MTWDARRKGTHGLACTRCGRELYLEQAVLVAGLRVCATGPCAEARRRGRLSRQPGSPRDERIARGTPATAGSAQPPATQLALPLEGAG
jgi:hypothetical protein